MARITPFLWFDDQAEAAAENYVAIFPNSRITQVQRNGAAGPGPAGTVLMVTFELEGLEFTALNGGPQFTFNEAISLYTSCGTQDEVDEVWRRLSEDGEEGQCGWLKDRYGVSWQVVPEGLPVLLADSDPARVAAVVEAMLPMGKLDIDVLQAAYDAAG